MRRPKPLPPSLAENAFFSRSTAADHRVDASRLRARDVSRPFHGVQGTSTPVTLHERCTAYVQRMRPGDAFSHATAIALHGLPLPPNRADPAALDVCAVHPAAAPAAKGVIGHRLRARPPVVVVGGLPVCDPIEAWCQIAGSAALEDLVAIADELLNRADDPDQQRTRMQQAVDAPGRYRTAVLRQALALARVGSRSPQESRLRVILVLGGIPEPALNAGVRDRVGRLLGHGDLVWEAARVVSEYEGDQHRTDHEQWAYDIRRYDDFAAAGWTLVRVPAESLHRANRLALVERFRTALSA